MWRCSEYAAFWKIRCQNPGTDTKFALLHIAQTGSGDHPALYSIRNGFISREQSSRGVMLTTRLRQLRQAPRSRISGAIPLLPLYAFVPWTRTTLSLAGVIQLQLSWEVTYCLSGILFKPTLVALVIFHFVLNAGTKFKWKSTLVMGFLTRWM